MNIAEIRHEGYYLKNQEEDIYIPHTEMTYELLTRACEMADNTKYFVCHGVIFENNKPYAELIDFNGVLTYKELSMEKYP